MQTREQLYQVLDYYRYEKIIDELHQQKEKSK